MRFFRQEYWNGLPCLPPDDLPDLGIQCLSSMAPSLQVDSLPLALPGKPSNTPYNNWDLDLSPLSCSWLLFKHTVNSSVQLLNCVQLFAIPWTAARQASLSITNSRSLLKLMSIESVMPSNHLILCRPLLLPPSKFPSIRVFSNESVLHIK